MFSTVYSPAVRKGESHLPQSHQAVCVLSCFSCVRLCDPVDRSWPGSSVHGILQAGILEWVAVPFSPGYWCEKCVHIYTPRQERNTLRWKVRWIALRSCCIAGTVNCIYSTRRHFISFLLSWNWCKGLSELLLLALGPTSKNRRGSLNDTSLRAAVPHLFGTRDHFHRRKVFPWPWVVGDDFRMIQTHYI